MTQDRLRNVNHVDLQPTRYTMHVIYCLINLGFWVVHTPAGQKILRFPDRTELVTVDNMVWENLARCAIYREGDIWFINKWWLPCPICG